MGTAGAIWLGAWSGRRKRVYRPKEGRSTRERRKLYAKYTRRFLRSWAAKRAGCRGRARICVREGEGRLCRPYRAWMFGNGCPGPALPMVAPTQAIIFRAFSPLQFEPRYPRLLPFGSRRLALISRLPFFASFALLSAAIRTVPSVKSVVIPLIASA